MRRIYIILYLFVWVSGSSAFAASLQEARAKLSTGHYDTALNQASSLGTQDGILLAAEILNTKVMLGQSSRPKKDARQAMALSQNVLAQTPGNAEAKMLYAFAYGFYARSASVLKAWRKKIPQKTYAAILEARAANPDDARSDALLGGWHLSVVYKAGASKAKRFYGADEQSGHDFFQKAIDTSSQDIFITGNYIMMLTALDNIANKQKVFGMLDSLQTTKPVGEPERHMLLLLSGLRSAYSEPEQAKKMAKIFLEW